MTEADVIAALRAHWLSNGPAVDPGALLLWDDDPDPGPVDQRWTRTLIRSAGGVRVTVGRGREENRGLVTAQVFSPLGAGPGPAERLASAVAQCWRTCRPPRIWLGAPSVVGLPAEGAFNRQLVTVGWRADIRPPQ